MYIRATISQTMKKAAFFLLLCISFIACKNEAPQPAGNDTYLTEVVGTAHGGKFVVTNGKAIKQGWQTSPVTDTIDIAEFEIVHGLTEGDAKEEYYLLVAKNKAGDTRTAVPLTLKNEKFYFEEPGQTTTYLKTTCKGGCIDACQPIIKVAEGARYLICSPCRDCRKMESEMR